MLLPFLTSAHRFREINKSLTKFIQVFSRELKAQGKCNFFVSYRFKIKEVFQCVVKKNIVFYDNK